jgi:cytochrome d ubiquinol oxidase subunit I
MSAMLANTFDPALLSRFHFAWVIGWHIPLPAFTVGLGSFIAVLEGLKLATGRDVYVRISTFWIKIFAIAFGMGVVTGIVMPFQFPLCGRDRERAVTAFRLRGLQRVLS